MEDYEEFVKRELSQLRKPKGRDEEEKQSRPASASSLVRFYGRSILPPLLSEERRGEMRQYRVEAQKVSEAIKLRKTPTPEEFPRESGFKPKTVYTNNAHRGPVSTDFDSLKTSPWPVTKENDGLSLSPVTSTPSSAFFASYVTPRQSHFQACPVNREGPLSSSPGGVNQRSPSPGYVAQDSEENDIFVSATIDAGSGSCGSDSTGEAYSNDFFLHGTSNTIYSAPEIISCPPIDGEELEKSGLESVYCTSIPDESVTCDPLASESLPEGVHVEHDEDYILDRCEEPVQTSQESCDSVNPDLLEILSTHWDWRRQQEPTETEPDDSLVVEARPSEEPRRQSLQALLKKSQEYRRCQRMLRHQSRSTKVQERIPQPNTIPEGQSLSDKENDEFPARGGVTKQQRKMVERRCTSSPTVQMSQRKSQENERLLESGSNQKKTTLATESGHFIESSSVKRTEEGTTLKNNTLNISQEVLTVTKHTGDFILRPPLLTEASPGGQAFCTTTAQTSGAGHESKCSTLPPSHFCTSPVHSESKSAIRAGGRPPAYFAENSNGMLRVNTGINDDLSLEEEGGQAHPSMHAEDFSAADLDDRSDPAAALVKSSEQIDELESNLSGLQALISDLASTVKDNFENRSPTDGNTQSECSFGSAEDAGSIPAEQRGQRRQNESDPAADTLEGCDFEGRDAGRADFPGQPSDRGKNELDDTEPEPRLGAAGGLSVVIQGEGDVVPHLREGSRIPTSAIERFDQKATRIESPAGSCGPHSSCINRQPAAQSVGSAAEWKGIPVDSRKSPSEIMAPCNGVPVLSDTSNRPRGRRNEAADDPKGHDSSGSPSLNRSYDVDSPWGMWFSLGSGSGAEGQRDQEKHLSPKSGSDSEGGASKVKRRLLMHLAEETQKRCADGGASVAVTPISASPRAAACRHEGQGGHNKKQEQLKQANAAQIRALQEEHRRQQEELMQMLVVRYHFLQGVSIPPSTSSSSRLWDTLTFPTLSEALSPLSEGFRPLLLAAAKGFLTRRLFKTERVAQLVRTIRDSEQFLLALQQHSNARPESGRRQDLVLQGRVTLQLRAARYDIHDIFFSMSSGERMKIISWDRNLSRERGLRQQRGHTGHPRRNSRLSAATLKSLERKKSMMFHKVTQDRLREVVKKTGHQTGLSAKQPQQIQQGQFRANPQRVPKSAHATTRPR